MKVSKQMKTEVSERLQSYKDSPYYGVLAPFIRGVLRLKNWQYELEVRQVARKFGMGYEQALLLNLDYELGGGACTTAAVPSATGYRMVRALDWDVPSSFNIKWEELPEAPDVRHRHVPGYVGVLTGHNRYSNVAVSINQAVDWPGKIQLGGQPISWIIRDIITSRDEIEHMVDDFLKSKPITSAFIILVSRDEAYWLHLGRSGGNRVVKHVEFPELLCVCNSAYQSTEEKMALRHWMEKEDRHHIPYPVYNADTADLVSFRL